MTIFGILRSLLGAASISMKSNSASILSSRTFRGFAQFERWRGKRVLEVGCGIGTAAVNFARYGADYTGIDLLHASVDLTRQRLGVYGLQGPLITCNAEQLSDHVEKHHYHLVYSFGVIHHSPNQRAIVEEIRKVIRNDGEFRCMLYAKNSWKDIMIEAGFDQPEAQRACHMPPHTQSKCCVRFTMAYLTSNRSNRRTFFLMSSRST